MQLMDNYRQQVGARISEVTRSSVRPPGILDLPNEILVQISELVYDSYDPPLVETEISHEATPLRNIQNLRLVCRRFCATSSHLLLDQVSVVLEPKSVSRLVEISQHPTIRKGVRSLSVDVYTYQSGLELGPFATMLSKKIAQDARRANMLPSEGLPYPRSGPHSTDSHPFLDACNELAAKWKPIGEPGSANWVDPDAEAFQACHKIYQQLCRDQQSLIGSEGFFQMIANAFAQFPFLEEVSISDDGGPMPIGRRSGLLCDTPMDLIASSIGALSGARFRLSDLRIELSAFCRPLLLNPGSETHEDLFQVGSNLEWLKITLGPLRDDLGGAERESFVQFLKSLCSNEDLVDITIASCFGAAWGSIGPALTGRKYSKLQTLSLHDVSIHGHELVQLLSGLKPKGSRDGSHPGTIFHLSSVYLISGSWIEVLDSMRGKAADYSDLTGLSGAECAHLPPHVHDAIFEVLETGPLAGWSRAVAYVAEYWVLGPDARNPLLGSLCGMQWARLRDNDRLMK